MALTEILFCDNHKFKQLYMAFMIRNGQKRNKLNWYLTLLHPLIWIFKRSSRPKWFLQTFCHKKSTHMDHSYLTYALVLFSKLSRCKNHLDAGGWCVFVCLDFIKPFCSSLLAKMIFSISSSIKSQDDSTRITQIYSFLCWLFSAYFSGNIKHRW